MEQQTFQQPTNPPAQPKNWLVESILVTLFCCLPFGIAGIVFAAQVSSKWAAGDYAGALQASKDAARWTKIGFFVGLGIIVLYIIAIFGFGFTAFWARRNNYNY
jgi:Interferon-induced transmembrane protein